MGNPFFVASKRNVQFLVYASWGLAFLLTLVACGGGPPPPVNLIPAEEVPTTQEGEAELIKSLVPFQEIGPGDLLEVVVRRGAGEERYTPTVREDGTVSVSFKDISIAGLSPGQSAERIESELGSIIRNPRVEVLLVKKAVSTQKVLVIGEIKRPGVYALERGEKLLQAIVDAEGVKDTARVQDVRIIRGQLANPVVLSANVEALLKSGDLTQNLQLQQNDIVFIPRTKIGDWNAFIEQIRPTLEVLVAMPLHTVFEVVLIQQATGN